MSQKTVSVKQIQDGDVIGFKKAVNGREHQARQYGVVINIARNDGAIVGFEVLPIIPHDANQYIANDPKNYMYARGSGALEDMGLDKVNPNKSWRLNYDPCVIKNVAKDLGTNTNGTVTRHGTIARTNTLDSIYHHLQMQKIERAALLGLTPEIRGNQTLVRAEEMKQGEHGRKTNNEIDRQNLTGQDALDPSAISRTRKGPPRFTPAKTSGVSKELNISLEDAAKLKLITHKVKKILQTITKAQAEPITTLKQAFEIASNNPGLLQAYIDAENDMTWKEALESGVLDFETDSPEKEKFFYDTINKGLASDKRKNTALTLNQIYGVATNDPNSITSLFDDGAEGEIALAGITESYLAAPVVKAPTMKSDKLVSAITKGWNKFKADEPYKNPDYREVQYMHPILSR